MDVVDSLGVINSLVAVRLGRITFGGNKLFYFIIWQCKGNFLAFPRVGTYLKGLNTVVGV